MSFAARLWNELQTGQSVDGLYVIVETHDRDDSSEHFEAWNAACQYPLLLQPGWESGDEVADQRNNRTLLRCYDTQENVEFTDEEIIYRLGSTWTTLYTVHIFWQQTAAVEYVVSQATRQWSRLSLPYFVSLLKTLQQDDLLTKATVAKVIDRLIAQPENYCI